MTAARDRNRRPQRAALALLGLGAVFSGCAANQAAALDGSSVDASAADGADVPNSDAASTARCDPSAAIDLSIEGTRDGAVTEYLGDNESSALGSIDVPFGQSPLEFFTDPEKRVVYPLLVQYKTRSDTSLEVSLGPATSSTLNGLVAVLGRCSGNISPDDFLGGLRSPFDAARVTTENLAAGTTVYLLVGGQPQAVDALPAPGHVRTNVDVTGPLDLVIRERAPLAPGGPCDGPGGVCAPAYHCVFSTCVLDGSWGGHCRGDGSCDVDLVCRDGSCEREVGPGASCGNSYVCASGSHCSHPNSTCVTDGTDGGACRDADPACDPGLECAIGYDECRPPRDCGQGGPCAPGESCNDQLLRCVPDGAAGGLCRDADPRCDAGSECIQSPDSSRLCLAILDDGAVCALGSHTDTCGANSACASELDGSRISRCTPRGALWSTCRDARPQCDAGLGCSLTANVCMPAHEPGELCASDACVEGYSCPMYVSSESPPRCTAEGQVGARCRDSGPACDDGLFCVPAYQYPICIRALGPGEDCALPGAFARCAPGSACFGHADGRFYCEPLRECALPGPACPPGQICGMVEPGAWSFLRCHDAAP